MGNFRIRKWFKVQKVSKIVMQNDAVKRLGTKNIQKILQLAPFFGKSIVVLTHDANNFFLSGSGKSGTVWKENWKGVLKNGDKKQGT